MLNLSTAQQEALAERQVSRRMFVWCEARHPDTGEPDPAGFWDDVGVVEMGGRTYYGSGLVQIGTMSAQSDLSIRGLTVTLSGIDQVAVAKVRGSTLGQAPIEVSLGIFDVATRALVGDLIPRFIGFVDGIEVNTAAAGDKSTIVLNCASTSRALTRKSTDTRAPGILATRFPSDRFYDYTAGQAQQAIYFGRKGGSK
jgi:hypothetical protein